MNTQQLIHTLASDLQTGPRPARSRPRWLRLAVLTGLASLVSLAALLLLLAPSPHLAHGPSATIGFSALAGAALAAVAFWATLKLSYPEGRLGLGWLLLPLGILLLGLGLEMSDAPSSSWSARLWGASPAACFLCVTALSLPILAAALVALRDGAPTHPRLCGAMAGLLAGGIAAALYTLHCPENSLLFVASWHVLAVLAVTMVGALAADRWLRW
ncbi:MAG: NrsF family protein [Reyranella sp.]